MNQHDVASRIETFIRNSFQIAADDPGFRRDVDLFELGYVDSVGVIETLAFIASDFGVEVPDEALLSDDFATIDGMARVVADLVAVRPQSAVAPAA